MSIISRRTQTQLERLDRREVVPAREPSTDRVYMRPLVRSDQGVFIDALRRSRDSLRRWIPLEQLSEDEFDYFDRLVDMGAIGDHQGSAQRRGVFTHDDEFVGVVNLIKIDRGLEWSAEIIAWFDERYQGQGLGTHAIRAMVDHGCADVPVGLGLHSIRAHICMDNVASHTVATRIGFVATGQTDLFDINGALVRHHEFIYRPPN